MPIASSAAWAGAHGNRNHSSRSSLSSHEHHFSDPTKNGGNGQISLHSSDDFKDNNNKIPTSIRENSNQQLSQLECSHSVEEEETIEGLNWIQQKAGELVDDERSQLFILILIAINSAMYGVATYPFVKDNPEIVRNFEIIDFIVLVIFTIESVLYMVYFGPKRFFKNGWITFDLVIVIASWLAFEIDELRAFRVFRAFRFVTRVSILRNVVVALFSIIPAITAIFTLLLLIFYIFAVMFTTLFKDMYAEGYTNADYFGRMDFTLFTLFQLLCLDEWSGIAYEITAVYYWAWAIFIAFIVMSAFVVVNLLIAVICDALQILRTAEEAMAEEKRLAKEQAEHEEELAQRGDDASTSHERMIERVNEMQQMLDEMIIAQESMARTIQYLSIALYAERKPDELISITENMSEDSSNRGGEEIRR